MFGEVRKLLEGIDIPTDHSLFKKLLEEGHVDSGDPVMTNIPVEIRHKLYESNILSEHYNYKVTFHARYVATYFKENLYWLKQ